METYIALLRGINVGGRNKIKMVDLKTSLLLLGLENVQTYIQSGNIIFNYKKMESNEIEQLLKAAILESFELVVPVLVLTKKELEYAFLNNPFLKEKNIDPKTLHVTFLKDKPKQTLAKSLENPSKNNDQFIIHRKMAYVSCPNGYGKTKLTNGFFEKKLDQPSTTRNWNTITKLMALCAAV